MLPKRRIDSVSGRTRSSKQLGDANEHGDEAGADAVLELVDREELAQVFAHAETAEAFDLEHDERDDRQADGDVDVARGRAQELDSADDRQQAGPVREQDQQEEADEDRRCRARAARPPIELAKLSIDS